MILILSEQNDVSTDKVSEWLDFYAIPYLRLDKEYCTNIIQKIDISNKEIDVYFEYNKQSYNINNFKMIWCRRGFFSIAPPHPSTYFNKKIPIEAKQLFQHQLSEERLSIFDFIGNFIVSKNHINDMRKYNVNKLIVLQQAIRIGLKIPETVICKNAENLSLKGEIITKTIKDVFKYKGKKYLFDLSVRSLFKESVKNEEFYYSLFQHRIKREIEIRTFIFQKDVFSMAIFPMDKNITDVRNGDVLSTRMLPFNLPKQITAKLQKLLKIINIESASIDLIYNGKDFMFLELNPAGQFDYLSVRCNHYIEKTIALKLKQFSFDN